MDFTLLNKLHIVPGFYPIASLLTGAILYILYRLFIRMRCQSRQAQMFLTFGMCIMTLTLFFHIKVLVESTEVESVEQDAITSTATEAQSLSFDKSRITSGLDTQLPPTVAMEDRSHGFEKIKDIFITVWYYVQSNMFMVYGAGFVLLLLYMIAQIVQLHYIRRKSTFHSHRGCIRIYQSPCTAPFSYSYNIFLPYDMKEEQMDFVLSHEENHIWHRHFYKLLFLQSLTIVNWFNPFAYLIFRSVKELQEMEVDCDVLNNGFDREQYQLNLVLTCTEHKEWVWSRSNYNYSSLKERILFMNRNVRSSKSLLLILVSGLCFVVLTGMISIQEVKRLEAPKNLFSETDSDISKYSESIGMKKEYDSRGCWTMLFIGDSAYTNYRMPPYVKHYKFFGNKATLTIAIPRENPDGCTVIVGSTGDYDPFSETLVREGGQVRPRKWLDVDHFDDTWKDTYNISPLIPSVWKTERWERCTPPEVVKRTADAYKQCQERKDKLKDVWQLINTEQDIESYKLFGKDRFFSVNLRQYERENLFYTYTGCVGDFAYIDDSSIMEGKVEYNLKWIDEDTFSYKNLNGETLTYVRVKMPEVIKQVLEGCGLE